MADEFGAYDDLQLDGTWEYEAKVPSLKQESYNFIIRSVERKINPDKGSIGYQFELEPYQDQFGQQLTDLDQISQRLKTYMYLGTVTNNRILESPYATTLKVFLMSIDVNPMATGKWTITSDLVNGIVITAPVVWEKVLSKNANPKTGETPTEINDEDPFSYYWATKINNNAARGIRAKDGTVVKVL